MAVMGFSVSFTLYGSQEVVHCEVFQDFCGQKDVRMEEEALRGTSLKSEPPHLCDIV